MAGFAKINSLRVEFLYSMRVLRPGLIVLFLAQLAAAAGHQPPASLPIQAPKSKLQTRSIVGRSKALSNNVIIITLDTTRADRMDFLGSKRGLTPNLDLLAKDGIVFTRAYSHVPLTPPSHATILTGTYT